MLTDKTDDWDERNAKSRVIVQTEPGKFEARYRSDDLPMLPDYAPKIGSKWRHYKGDDYEVVGHALHSETLRWMIAYQHGDGPVWVRPLIMWRELVTTETGRVPRFTPLFDTVVPHGGPSR